MQSRCRVEPRKDMAEFESAAALRAHYAALQKKQRRLSVIPKPPPPPPRPEPEPPPPPQEQAVEPPPKPRPPPINRGMVDRIMWETCHYFGITRNALVSGSRRSAIVLPRHVAMYLTRELLKTPSSPKAELSLPTIGRIFGGRDHTTVLNAIAKIERGLINNPEVAEAVATIRERFRGAL